MRKNSLNLLIALTLSLSCSGAIAADLPKSKLPSQEPTLSVDAPRESKVITNPHPTLDDKVGATEVEDATPGGSHNVDRSQYSKEVVVPVKTVDGRQALTSDGKFKVRQIKDRKTMALALGGGGARGAAHIGVLKVFEQEGIPIDYIVGNSMGAIIGGLYSAGVSIDKLEHFGTELRKNYLPGKYRYALKMPVAKLFEKFRSNRYAGVCTGNKLERYIEALIPEQCKEFENFKVPFSAVACNLRDGKAYRISEGHLATAIRASSSIAPILKPVAIGDKLYIDGGVRANLPCSSARDTGADLVIGVLVDEPLRELPKEQFYKFAGVANRMSDIVLAVVDEHQLQFADIVINPDVSGIPVLNTEEDQIAVAIAEGEKAARKAVPQIRKLMGLPEGSRLVDTGAGTSGL